MDPFDWEHRETRPRGSGVAPGSGVSGPPDARPARAEPEARGAQGAQAAPAATPPPATVGIFEALPLPEPPPIPVPPPPAPAPVAELSASWVAQSSKAPSGRRSFMRIALALGLVVAIAAAAVVFFFGRDGSTGGTALAMSFQQGASWRYLMHMSLDLTATAAGRSVPLQADISAGVRMKVVSIDGSASRR